MTNKQKSPKANEFGHNPNRGFSLEAEDFDIIDGLDSEGDNLNQPTQESPWRILVVDDEKEVHLSTQFALRDFSYDGKGVVIESCYSAFEAEMKLSEDPNFACVLLDVVMETPESGLELTHFIRQKLGLKTTRIILRTGQPGNTSEDQIIKNYDIDDYKNKNELTHKKLHVTLTSALRTYNYIKLVEQAQTDLNQVLNVTNQLNSKHQVETFLLGMQEYLITFFANNAKNVHFLRAKHYPAEKKGEAPIICLIEKITGGGLVEVENLEALGEETVTIFHKLLAKEECNDNCYQVGLHIQSDDNECLIFIALLTSPITETDLTILKLFKSNATTCYKNLLLIEKLKRWAFVDQLTGLANHQSFSRYLKKNPNIAEGKHLAIIIADIDNFYKYNEGLSHKFGNQLIISVGGKLFEAFPDNLLIARLYADTFAIAALVDNEVDLRKKLESALETCFFEVSIDKFDISATVGVSFGASLVSNNENHSQGLREAGLALKKAKLEGKRQINIYNEQLIQKAAFQVKLINNLSNELQTAPDNIQLYYQPQIDLDTGICIGAEALVRWCDSEGSIIYYPNDFIQAAEESGLIIELGEHIIRAAFTQHALWHQQGYTDFQLGINLSADQLNHRHFLELMARIIKEYKIDPNFIELEITESCLMDDLNFSIERLNFLKALGFKIAIDDFGTGFSSLNYSKHIPVDTIKIDKSFIDNIHTSNSDFAIAKLIVNLAKELNAEAIAEGIETQEQANQLARTGCKLGQGYFWGKPMSAEDLEDYISNN